MWQKLFHNEGIAIQQHYLYVPTQCLRQGEPKASLPKLSAQDDQVILDGGSLEYAREPNHEDLYCLKLIIQSKLRNTLHDWARKLSVVWL